MYSQYYRQKWATYTNKFGVTSLQVHTTMSEDTSDRTYKGIAVSNSCVCKSTKPKLSITVCSLYYYHFTVSS